MPDRVGETAGIDPAQEGSQRARGVGGSVLEELRRPSADGQQRCGKGTRLFFCVRGVEERRGATVEQLDLGKPHLLDRAACRNPIIVVYFAGVLPPSNRVCPKNGHLLSTPALSNWPSEKEKC